MKNFFYLSGLLIFVLSAGNLSAQDINQQKIQQHKQQIDAFRQQKDATYKIPEKTMLTPALLKDFKGLKYFPVDFNYKVDAQLTRLETLPKIVIKTSTGEASHYVVYGTLSFKINGKDYQLNVYQSARSIGSVRTQNALFLPFTDKTSGKETYGGGRYLVLDIPNGDTLTLDFNRAYNPYCVYNPNHSCPIPPKENDLAVRIPVGEKMYN
jgi:uncharacterized protein